MTLRVLITASALGMGTVAAGVGGYQWLSADCDTCAVIEGITPRVVEGEASAGSAIAGAIIGGVIGHQFGSGTGRKLATVASAAGGAIAGREIERRHDTHTVFELTLKMDDGSRRTLSVASIEDLYVGAPVEIRQGRVVRTGAIHSEGETS